MPLATARHLSMALGENARKYAIQNFGLDVARMPGDLVIGLLELYMGDGGKSDAVPQAGAVTQAGKGMFGHLCKHGVPMSSHSDSVREVVGIPSLITCHVRRQTARSITSEWERQITKRILKKLNRKPTFTGKVKNEQGTNAFNFHSAVGLSHPADKGVVEKERKRQTTFQEGLTITNVLRVGKQRLVLSQNF
ncbi:hypothetical protein MM560_G129n62 [Manis javanica]|nr:hypothetical protein MM560_G129n62 [Manis javanica]